MPSPAAVNFQNAVTRVLILYNSAGDSRLRPQAQSEREAFCHACLAGQVASWNAYVSNLVEVFFTVTANPLDVKFHAMHSLLKSRSEDAVKRFNTPNAENSRSLLASYTGYDPINDWVWPRSGLGGIQTRDRLNQILQVRHSFAHGYPIPTYAWTQSAQGKVSLTKAAVLESSRFFDNLVRRTDRGMRAHVQAVFAKTPW